MAERVCQVEGCEKDISSPKEYRYITSQNMDVCERHAEIFVFLSQDYQNKLKLWKTGKMN